MLFQVLLISQWTMINYCFQTTLHIFLHLKTNVAHFSLRAWVQAQKKAPLSLGNLSLFPILELIYCMTKLRPGPLSPSLGSFYLYGKPEGCPSWPSSRGLSTLSGVPWVRFGVGGVLLHLGLASARTRPCRRQTSRRRPSNIRTRTVVVV